MGVECRRCGARAAASARFCAACGSALATASAAVRKTVTVLFTDVIGLAALRVGLDPELARRTESRLYADLRAVLEEHGATVEKYAGDTVMAVFGVPVAREDDALRAASAALALEEATAKARAEAEERSGQALVLRSALNTGEVLASPDRDESLVLGEAVVVAARLVHHAGEGEVLVGPDTAQLLRQQAVTGEPRELLLRGRSSAVRAHPLLEVRAAATSGRRTELLGRDADRAMLTALLDRTVRSSTAHLVTVLGEAGVGKSRLVEDFLAASGSSGVFVRRVRCRSFGARQRWSPLPALLQGLPTDALPEDAQVVLRGLQGDGPVRSPEEVGWALALEAEWLAEQAPCVIVLEDLHGAEPEALEVVQDVVRRLVASPVLVVVTARPTLHDACPGWGTGLRQAMSLRLSPLSPADARRVVVELLAPGLAPDDVVERVVEAAGGNPLFLEQVVSVLVEGGRLVRTGGRWTVTGGDDLDLPPTVAALLAARLDRLPDAERHVLERAALLGKELALPDLADLVDPEHRPDLDRLVAALVRRELLRPVGRRRAFPSSLVREAAYAGLPRAERARLHERVGRSLLASGGSEELAGGHLEQAVRHLAEIGTAADEGLRAEAADLLASAGTRMLTGDAGAARSLLERAAALMDDERRLLAVPDLARVQALTGDLVGAERLLRDALAEAGALGHELAVAHARLALADLQRSTSPDAVAEDVESLVEEVLPVLRAAGDDRGQSLAWQLQASAHQYHVRWGAMVEPLERALHHATRAGDARLVELAESLLVGSLYHGPTHVDDVARRLEAMAGGPGISPSHRASVLARLGGTRALQGQVTAAVRVLDEVRADFVALGRPLSAAATAFVRGPVLLLAGDPTGAASVLDEACRSMQAMGDRAYVSTLLALLAEARWRCGDAPGAQSAIDACRRTAADSDTTTQLRWRSVQAKLEATQGDPAHARELADAAVRLAARTDEVVTQGEVLVDRADVRAALGDEEGAQQDLRDAVARFERKGAVQAVRRLAGRLVVPTDALPTPSPAPEPAPA